LCSGCNPSEAHEKAHKSIKLATTLVVIPSFGKSNAKMQEGWGQEVVESKTALSSKPDNELIDDME
jgi:hypothetical protein